MSFRLPRFFIALLGMLVVGIQLFTASASAYEKPKRISPVEWDAWPRICQGIPLRSYTWPVPPGRSRPKLSQQEHDLVFKLGLWHLCAAHIWVRRSELEINPVKRKTMAKKAFGDINYVKRQIGPDHVIAPLTYRTLARAYRQFGERDKALKELDSVRKHHPNDPNLYSVYTAIYFDEKDYPKAIEILEQGNQATGDKIGELQYFLGLAYFYTDQIDKARIYEEKARRNKYPFRALTRKLAEHDAKKASSSAQQ